MCPKDGARVRLLPGTGSAQRSKTQAEGRSGGAVGLKGQEVERGRRSERQAGDRKWGGREAHRDPDRLGTDPSQVWDRKWKEGRRDRRGCGAQAGWGQEVGGRPERRAGGRTTQTHARTLSQVTPAPRSRTQHAPLDQLFLSPPGVGVGEDFWGGGGYEVTRL